MKLSKIQKISVCVCECVLLRILQTVELLVHSYMISLWLSLVVFLVSMVKS